MPRLAASTPCSRFVQMPEIDRWAHILPEQQRAMWPHVAQIAERVGGTLMGGTAVAIHLEHRQSVDLDVMTFRKFSGRAIERLVQGFAQSVNVREAADNCYHARADGVELDIFRALPANGVDAAHMKVVQKGPVVDGMRIGSLPDLLATKLDVITVRPKFRDYMDLAAIDQRTPHTLEAGLTYYCKRFGHKNVPQHLESHRRTDRQCGTPPARSSLRRAERRCARLPTRPSYGRRLAFGQHASTAHGQCDRAVGLRPTCREPIVQYVVQEVDATSQRALHPCVRPQRSAPQPLICGWRMAPGEGQLNRPVPMPSATSSKP